MNALTLCTYVLKCELLLLNTEFDCRLPLAITEVCHVSQASNEKLHLKNLVSFRTAGKKPESSLTYEKLTYE